MTVATRDQVLLTVTTRDLNSVITSTLTPIIEMPCFELKTNVASPEDKGSAFIAATSRVVAYPSIAKQRVVVRKRRGGRGIQKEWNLL